MEIRLVRPTEQLKEQAIKFKQEFFDNHEMVINGSELFDKIDQYEDWLKAVTANTNIETVNVNWVVTDTFFAVDENGKIVGIIDLRVSKQTYTRSFYKFRFIGSLSAAGKLPFSRSKTCRLRTFPHSGRFSAMMQVHQGSIASRRKLLCFMFIFAVSWLCFGWRRLSSAVCPATWSGPGSMS